MRRRRKTKYQEKIKRYIDRAFIDTAIPSFNRLIKDLSWNQLDSEKKLTLITFQGKHWKEISLEVIIANDATPLIWFDEELFNFYLPAYIDLIVLYYDDFSGYLPADCLINKLTAPKSLPSPEIQNEEFVYRKKRFEGLQKLTQYQKECVKLFLELMDKEYGSEFSDKDYSFGEIEDSGYILPSPALALELYWSKV